MFDTAAQAGEGSGFEGVWQKSGRGQAQQRKLNWFATELGLGHKLTDEIEGMTVHNGWLNFMMTSWTTVWLTPPCFVTLTTNSTVLISTSHYSKLLVCSSVARTM